MHYQICVFDFDGVLADSVEVKTEAFAALYRHHGRDVVDAVVAHHRENGGMPRRQKFQHYDEHLLGKPANNARLDDLNGQFSRLVVDAIVASPEIDGCSDFLQSLSEKVAMYVDSAAPDNELTEIMERRGITPFFTAAYGSDKSKVENLQTIIDQSGTAPSDILFFGDAMSDYKAAMHCGTDFIGILGSTHSPFTDMDEIQAFKNFNEIQIFLSR
jgi:phosphoglycolate phosphatase-like HAD superfamily hydrolase